MKRYAPLLLLLLLAGCGKNTIVRHPDAINSLDSRTYDALTVAQSVLDNAKIAIAQGKLPVTAKPIANAGGKAYNELRDIWLEYRANPTASLEQRVIAAALELNRFILELRNMGVAK